MPVDVPPADDEEEDEEERQRAVRGATPITPEEERVMEETFEARMDRQGIRVDSRGCSGTSIWLKPGQG